MSSEINDRDPKDGWGYITNDENWPKPKENVGNTTFVYNDSGCHSYITLGGINGWTVQIDSDTGQVTFGEAYSGDEESTAFWKYLGGRSPYIK
jgi:hypothetical protein